MDLATLRYPTEIKFGWNSLSIIPDELKKAGVKRPLLVTDRHMTGLDFFTCLKDSLESKDTAYEVFSGTEGNPYKSHVEAGVSAFREHQADSIVAVGGGCAIDVAKSNCSDGTP